MSLYHHLETQTQGHLGDQQAGADPDSVVMEVQVSQIPLQNMQVGTKA